LRRRVFAPGSSPGEATAKRRRHANEIRALPSSSVYPIPVVPWELTMIRHALCLLGLLSLVISGAPASAEEGSFVIGIMNDQSGPYADLSGPSSVQVMRMAIEDFGGSVLGKKIELLVADHQNKVDVGMAIAREWYDEKGVRVIFDITNSGVALALQNLAKARDRLVIFDSASSSDLTGKACSPNGFQWNADNWSNGVSLMRLLVKQKLDTFFFITADYAFGASLEADARDAIAKAGGTTIGGVRAPLNTADFSSYLLSAQASGARVVVLANTGADLSTSLKQANEFGLTASQYIATPITYLSDVNALGLPIAHGLVFMQSWYWDIDDKTRAFAKRFFERAKRMPNDNQAALYSSVLHYLEAVRATGGDEALGVAKAMKAAPIHDVFTGDGKVREDGRVVYDRYLVKVKQPAESQHPWDYLSIEAKIPADEAFRPLGATGCNLAGAPP
jgi:branched-chain amino acid transport system substrate-binding protein